MGGMGGMGSAMGTENAGILGYVLKYKNNYVQINLILLTVGGIIEPDKVRQSKRSFQALPW